MAAVQPVSATPVDLSSIIISRNDIVKEGWLLKQSKFLKDWRRRWIVLTSQYLCSFRSPESIHRTPTEALRLSDCSTVRIIRLLEIKSAAAAAAADILVYVYSICCKLLSSFNFNIIV